MESIKVGMKEKKRIVVKVGTSTLTHSTGSLNLRIMDKLAMVLSDIKKNDTEIILVTSGSITAGVAKLKLKERPRSVKERQAAASVGQCELMFSYDKLFSQYGQMVSQILLTKAITDNDLYRNNIINTFETLLTYGVIPIVNENDTVSVDELVYGDNDTLSAITAKLVKADMLIILSDIDGFYDKNPQLNENAKLIPVIKEITSEIENSAGDSQSLVGTGGMSTKILAAKIATNSGIDMVICNGKNPESLYDILDGKQVGTIFIGKKVEVIWMN